AQKTTCRCCRRPGFATIGEIQVARRQLAGFSGMRVSTPLAQYSAALREAAAGRPAFLQLVDPTTMQPARRLAAQDWCADRNPGDDGLLARCTGPTLDVGCGPGRLVAALTAMGVPALGVDICAEAVRQARRRGASVQHACVFGPV